MSLPKHLYKYEPFTAQSLQNLKAQVIYFGSPLGFNDPYDYALSPSIKEPTNADLNILQINRPYGLLISMVVVWPFKSRL